jgi:hypothetical protein
MSSLSKRMLAEVMLKALGVHLLALGYCTVVFGSEVTGHVRLIDGSEHGKAITIVYAEALGEHAPPKPGHYEVLSKRCMA